MRKRSPAKSGLPICTPLLVVTPGGLTRGRVAAGTGRVAVAIVLLRALPIVPLSLVSAVLGVMRWPLGPFSLWTFAGSVPRCLLLGWLGWLLRDTYAGLAHGLNRVETIVSGLIAAGVIALVLWLRARVRRGLV